MGPEERREYDRRTAIIALIMFVLIIVFAILTAIMNAGCRYCIVTNNTGTVNAEQGKQITPKTSLTGIPGL